ncbi:ArnT family glycosyltransferase [Uliginosibacterium aquaticum]|uniref:Glycosyltransferase family 39 protein n=1 Tax=Uliginosibacterium aquaticum TaxID=2731212 RepID=A0ABX2IJR8_9RHOO|nr:glycosyltransferase family 39 protein [Uliginosibacterium aquaticum]NSL56542.1 glycosyltransferase family 39 protein [Uliginosibacterium aquaticum]
MAHMQNSSFTEFPSRKPAIHVPNWALILVFIAYALPGNIGHVPWRGDDALHIGVVFSMLSEGHWLTPQIAGHPFYDWPPLTYWLGALTGKLLGWLLPLHDAIRLGNVAALTVLIYCLRYAARELYGREAASAAAMLMLGSLGLLIHAHEMQPQIVLTATLAACLQGLTLMRSAPTRGALLTGAASGAAFLAGGLPGLFLCLPLWLLTPACSSEYRTRSFLLAYRHALWPLVLLVSLWPLALAVWQPDFLHAWWAHELAAILPHAGHLQRGKDFANLIGWFTWPLWPVVLWSLWHRRGKLRDFGHSLPLASALLALALVASTGGMRPANLLPLMPALILMASGELCRLRRGAANAFDWFGVMTFTLLGLSLWLAWSAMNFGWPAPLARNLLRLVPGFEPQWNGLQLLVAITLSVAWLIANLRLPFFQLRGAVHWALGVTLAWGLAATLLMSWIDHDKSYRSTAAEIAAVIASQPEAACVAGIDLGDSQRAALHYFAHIKIAARGANCPLRLAYATGRNALPEPGKGWESVWDLRRGRGRLAEQFALYRRVD